MHQGKISPLPAPACIREKGSLSLYQHASRKKIASPYISISACIREKGSLSLHQHAHKEKTLPLPASACIREKEAFPCISISACIREKYSLSLHQHASGKKEAFLCISMHQGTRKPLPASVYIKKKHCLSLH
jgi:hypothetical protein